MSIKVDNVTFTYMQKTPNEHQALKGVSFEIPDNSFTAIVGHTGSGKSTLIQMFNALLLPTSGTVTVDDFLITANAKIKNIKALRKKVGMVFQFPEYQLFEETIEKDVAFGLQNFGVKKEEALKKAHETLLALGLDESYFTRSPFDLSGGERRKVALAGILSINPDVLVLDEPTAGLDPKSSKEIMELVASLHEQGKTIIIITHDMDIVFKYAKQVIVLNDGRVSYNGDVENLFDSIKEDYNIEIPKMVEFISYLRQHGINIPKEESKNTKSIVSYIKKVRGNKHE